MTFGLKSAPDRFERTLYIMITKYKCKTCLVYFEDVIMFSLNVEDHMRNVDEILTTLHDAEVTLKLNKCHFFQ